MLRVYPLALAQLAGQINGHELLGFDPNMVPEGIAALPGICDEFKPNVVGVSFRNFDTAQSYNNISFLPLLEMLIKEILKSCPGTILVVGGTGFSLFPEPIMEKCRDIDVGFFLESDQTFPEFLDDPAKVGSLQGVYHRVNGEVTFNGRCERPDMGTLQIPDFDLFALEPYARQSLYAIGLEGKRGCDKNCITCIYPYFTGRQVLEKEPERALAEAEILASKGIRKFYWVDSVFNHPRGHAERICEAFIKAALPMTWGGYFSEDGFDKEMRDMAYEAGCRQFVFSPDGISKRAVKLYGRPATLENQNRAYFLVREKKEAEIHVAFLIGSPKEGIRDLFEFAGRLFYLVFKLKIWNISASFTRIYPHTGIWKIAIKEGLIAEEQDLLDPVYYKKLPTSLTGYLLHPVAKLKKLIRRHRKDYGDSLW